MSKPRLLTVIIFVGIFSLVLFIANLVVYESLMDIFALNTSAVSVALAVTLGLLSGSFIIATIIGMYFYNAFTRLYYLLSAVWIGFFVYLFFTSVLFAVLAVSLPVIPLRITGVVFVIGACLVSVYGIVHAKKIRVKNVRVPLENLPLKWRDRKAVWVSDLHLGQLHGAPFAKKVVEKINSLSHDIVFIGGDLFDGTGAPDVGELIQPLKSLSAPLGVYFITGNHEEFGDSSQFIFALAAAGIEVLQDKMVEIDGLQLIGVDYRNASERGRFQKILSGLQIDKKKAAILLKHEPKDLDVASAAGILFQISGHTHGGQVWPFGYVASLVYKGFVYGLKSFQKMQVYVSSGTGTWGPPMRVGTDCEIVVFTLQ